MSNQGLNSNSMKKKTKIEAAACVVALVVVLTIIYLIGHFGGKEVETDTPQQPANHAAIVREQVVDLGLSVKWAGWNVGSQAPEKPGQRFKRSDNWQEAPGWGDGWRLPTQDEMNELIDRCRWQWTTYQGVAGCEVTGPNGKAIFLPAAGVIFDTTADDNGTKGCYWTSQVKSNSGSGGRYRHIDFTSTRVNGHYGRINWQMSVRPVKS